MKKIFYYALLIMHCALLFTGCGGEEKQTLIVGIADSFPPLGFRNEQNEIVGFDIDLAKETAKRMNANFEFKPIDWTLKSQELDAGNVDMIWNGLNISNERKKIMLFSKPYMDNRQILLVRKDADLDIHSEYDLADKIVAVQAGSISEAYLSENETLKDTFKEFLSCASLEGAFQDLIDDKFDVLIVDELAGRYEFSKNTDELKVIDVKVGPVTEIGIGFRKDDSELRDRVQRAFDEIIRDGTAKKISEQWFQADLIKSVK